MLRLPLMLRSMTSYNSIPLLRFNVANENAECQDLLAKLCVSS